MIAPLIALGSGIGVLYAWARSSSYRTDGVQPSVAPPPVYDDTRAPEPYLDAAVRERIAQQEAQRAEEARQRAQAWLDQQAAQAAAASLAQQRADEAARVAAESAAQARSATDAAERARLEQLSQQAATEALAQRQAAADAARAALEQRQRALAEQDAANQAAARAQLEADAAARQRAAEAELARRNAEPAPDFERWRAECARHGGTIKQGPPSDMGLSGTTYTIQYCELPNGKRFGVDRESVDALAREPAPRPAPGPAPRSVHLLSGQWYRAVLSNPAYAAATNEQLADLLTRNGDIGPWENVSVTGAGPRRDATGRYRGATRDQVLPSGVESLTAIAAPPVMPGPAPSPAPSPAPAPRPAPAPTPAPGHAPLSQQERVRVGANALRTYLIANPTRAAFGYKGKPSEQVSAFQRVAKIKVDGVLGPDVRSAGQAVGVSFPNRPDDTKPAPRPAPAPAPRPSPAPVHVPPAPVANTLPAGYNPAAARGLASQVERNLVQKKKAGAAYDYSRPLMRSFQTAAAIKADGIYGGEARGALLYYGAIAALLPKPLFKPYETLPYSPPGGAVA